MKQVAEFVPVRFRTGFNDNGEAAGEAAGLCCRDVSLSVQDAKADCDINTIMSRYVTSGVAPQVTRVPLEGDFSEVTDYQSAMLAVQRAQESFLSLDGKVRERFGHDAGRFVDFCLDPANLPELRKMGLAPPAQEPPPAPAAPA